MNTPGDISFTVVRSTKPTSVIKTGGWRYLRPIHSRRLSPCRFDCPVGNDIAQFISHTSQGDFQQAYEVLMQENPMPGVCGRVCFSPCEYNCNRGRYDEPISIRTLERFASDAGDFNAEKLVHFGEKEEEIAVVGAGPAGLSCAYFLRRLGFRVTILERFS